MLNVGEITDFFNLNAQESATLLEELLPTELHGTIPEVKVGGWKI